MFSVVEDATRLFLAGSIHELTIIELMAALRLSIITVVERRPLPPLLEKERHACGCALIARAPEPIRMCGPRIRSALATNNYPTERRKFFSGRSPRSLIACNICSEAVAKSRFSGRLSARFPFR